MKLRNTYALLSSALLLVLALPTACAGSEEKESNTGNAGGETAVGSGGQDQAGQPCDVECTGPGTCELTSDGAPHCICEEGYLAFGLTCLMPNEEGVVVNTNRPTGKGVAPLAVYFDASATSCSGDSCNSFHDLHFEWDFNDPSTETWGPSGKSRNTAIGALSAHVYEKPGTYQAVLRVHDGDEVRTSTHEIVVEDPDIVFAGVKTTCISTAGNFEGCPDGARTVESSNAARELDACLAVEEASRCLLRRGETFDRGGDVSIAKPDPTLVGSFGDPSQPNPEFLFDGRGFRLFEGVRDLRIVGLHLVGGSNKDATVLGALRRFENLLVMDTTTEPGTIHQGLSFSSSVLELAGDDLHDGLFFVNNDWRQFGYGSGGNIVGIAAKRIALLGNTLLDSQAGEHVIRVFHGEKAIISNNQIGISAATKQALTLRSLDGRVSREFLVSDNLVWGTEDWPITLVGKNASDQVAHGVDYILERNFVMRSPSGEDFGIQRGIIIEGGTAERVTIRNNILWMEDWQGYNGIAGGDYVYNNTCYTPNTDGTCVSSNGSLVFGNLFYAPNCAADDCDTATGANVGENLLVTDASPFVSDMSSGDLVPSDFALRDGSPAIAAGVETPLIRYDFTMRERTGVDSKAHAGAMQWHPAPEDD